MSICITVNGRIAQKGKLVDFAYDTISSFFNANFKRDVFIDINISSTVIGGELLGYCIAEGDEIEIGLSRRDIDGNLMSLELIAQNLAHELVHAKQHLKGQINFLDGYRRNRKTKFKCYKETPYKKTPWEQEAYGLEESLFEKFWV